MLVRSRWTKDQRRTELTYSCTDGHEHVTDNLGVIHHNGLHCAVQHADLKRPLLLLVLKGVLTERGDA